MLRKPDRSTVVSLAAGVVLALVALALFLLGVIVGGHPSRTGLSSLPEPLRGVFVGEAAGGLTSEVLDILERDYYREIDRDALDAEAADDVVAGLDDPYTEYLTPEEYRALQAHNDGRYSGIGVQVSPRDQWIEIVGVTRGGPVEDAGLRIGDRIVRSRWTPRAWQRHRCRLGPHSRPGGHLRHHHRAPPRRR